MYYVCLLSLVCFFVVFFAVAIKLRKEKESDVMSARR